MHQGSSRSDALGILASVAAKLVQKPRRYSNMDDWNDDWNDMAASRPHKVLEALYEGAVRLARGGESSMGTRMRVSEEQKSSLRKPYYR
jgi:hypothetical protein